MYEEKPVEHYHSRGFSQEDYDHFRSKWEEDIVESIGWMVWAFLQHGLGLQRDDRGAIGEPLIEAAFKMQLHEGIFGPLRFQTQAEKNEWDAMVQEGAGDRVGGTG